MEPGVVKLLEPGVVNQETVSSLTEYLSIIFPLAIGLAATLAVLMIAIGGIQYMFSNVPGVKGEGLNRIREAIWGLLLALAAYLILYTINPDLVALKLTIPS